MALECPKEGTPASGLKDQQVLDVWGYCQLFQHSVETLRSQLQEKGEGAELVWDKVKTRRSCELVFHLIFPYKNVGCLYETCPKL